MTIFTTASDLLICKLALALTINLPITCSERNALFYKLHLQFCIKFNQEK